jgi:hypothetical protein
MREGRDPVTMRVTGMSRPLALHARRAGGHWFEPSSAHRRNIRYHAISTNRERPRKGPLPRLWNGSGTVGGVIVMTLRVLGLRRASSGPRTWRPRRAELKYPRPMRLLRIPISADDARDLLATMLVEGTPDAMTAAHQLTRGVERDLYAVGLTA